MSGHQLQGGSWSLDGDWLSRGLEGPGWVQASQGWCSEGRRVGWGEHKEAAALSPVSEPRGTASRSDNILLPDKASPDLSDPRVVGANDTRLRTSIHGIQSKQCLPTHPAGLRGLCEGEGAGPASPGVNG